MASSTVDARSEAGVALKLACEHLLSLQDDAGWWRGELQTNVTMDAEDILLREFLGVRRADETRRSVDGIAGIDLILSKRDPPGQLVAALRERFTFAG